MIDCLVNGLNGIRRRAGRSQQYSENIRKFSLRQQYYSNAAYQSLRHFFNKNLPSRRTMQMWLSSIDGSPGISESALAIIREKAVSYQAEKQHQMCVALISDEMSIRKHISFDPDKKSFSGFSTVSNSSKQFITSQNESDMQAKIAKDALVLLAVGPDFKVPIAYHLLNGLDAIDRAALTLETIRKVEETGCRVITLTSDGLNANMAVAELLGAKFDEDKPYFFSPIDAQRKIYIILDPPHMLKLVREYFCESMIYHQDRLADWNLIRKLVERQSSDNFNLCNKLTRHHIRWDQNPMNVKLATQTISKSVADTLEQLSNDGYEEFKDCQGTVDFLRYFNDAFDILNFAGHKQADGRFKEPVCAATAERIFEFSGRFQQFLVQLELQQKTKRVPLLGSGKKTGFFGFYHNFISLRGIYEDLILNGQLEVFYPFQFSQDHLETFFSLIRYDNSCLVNQKYFLQ